jgi:hypothetical protein
MKVGHLDHMASKALRTVIEIRRGGDADGIPSVFLGGDRVQAR